MTGNSLGIFAGLGICFYGDEPEVEMSDGLVHVFQETRDMYDMNDPNIYVVLDEGCNSTCHSKHWAEVVETKLQTLGYHFPFNDTKGKTFSGLGAGGTSTEGSRTLPFSLNFRDRQCIPVHGVLESHQLSTAHLGLVKDLKHGTISIGGNQLPVFRCAQTHRGLIMLAITPQQLDKKGVSPQDSSKPIPKCHRKFRTAFAAVSDPDPMASLTSDIDFHSSSVNTMYETLEGLDTSNVPLVTSGTRWTHRQPEFYGATLLQIDCRHFHDPDADKGLRGHLGRHPDIMKGFAQCHALQQLVVEVKNFLRQHPGRRLVIHLYCTSGRHRSVGVATMIF